MLDELAYAGPEHLDAGFVGRYDRKQGNEPDLAAAADLDLLRSHGVGPESTVIDLGAGTGRFVVAIAPHVRRLVAADVSPAMVEHLKRKIAELRANVAPTALNVEVVRAGLLSYAHDGRPADAVHTRNTLHQIPDAFKVVALQRISLMLKRGGILRLHDLVYDTTPSRFVEHLETWLDGAASDPAAGYTREDLAEHVRTEHSTFTWLLEPMFDKAGLQVVDRDVRRGVYASYTCVRR